ncbi:MAG: DUF362 domain-containing protein [Candidatus Hodarchaeota archaeon]
MSEVYFADALVAHLEKDKTLPYKMLRLLDAIDIGKKIKGKKVLVKMHLGGIKGESNGYTTIHPFFVHMLVKKLKESGAKSVMIYDGYQGNWTVRGYTKQSVGAPLKALFPGKTELVQMGFKTLDEAEISKKILDAEFLLVFSHVKGHGDCGFGGAGKNIAMGCTPTTTRSKIHALEGGIVWDEEKCKHCNKCIDECPNHANKFTDEGKYEIFYHNCKFCRHCELACPEGAISTENASYEDFQEGNARIIKHVLDTVGPDNVLFVNVLLNITIFCDCWGFSTPSLVPDIGIMASTDLVAIDRASLDAIKVDNLLPNGLPKDRELGDGEHLFEKIHGKNPYIMGEKLEQLGWGSTKYELKEVE